MTQLRVGDRPTYYGKTFTCGRCPRTFRCRASTPAGRGWATQRAEANRDRHQAAHDAPAQRAHAKALRDLRRQAAEAPAVTLGDFP